MKNDLSFFGAAGQSYLIPCFSGTAAQVLCLFYHNQRRSYSHPGEFLPFFPKKRRFPPKAPPPAQKRPSPKGYHRKILPASFPLCQKSSCHTADIPQVLLLFLQKCRSVLQADFPHPANAHGKYSCCCPAYPPWHTVEHASAKPDGEQKVSHRTT